MGWFRPEKKREYWEGPYRDPLPGEEVPDDPLLRHLSPERRAYWQQVREFHTPRGVCLTTRLSNSSHTEYHLAIIADLAERLADLEKKLA